MMWLDQIQQTPLIIRVRHVARQMRGLVPLGLTLLLIGGALLLRLGGTGVQSGAQANGTHGMANTGASEQALAAPTPRIAAADIHAETVLQGKDVEINLALTQTQNDCQAPLNGGVCLRYTVLEDEQATLAGYGVIPAADVQMTPGVITLHVDTSTVHGFVYVVGSSVLINATWRIAASASNGAGSQRANVQGGIGQYAIPSPSSSTTVVATMNVR